MQELATVVVLIVFVVEEPLQGSYSVLIKPVCLWSPCTSSRKRKECLRNETHLSLRPLATSCTGTVARQRLAGRLGAAQPWVVWVTSRQRRVIALGTSRGRRSKSAKGRAFEGSEEGADNPFHKGGISFNIASQSRLNLAGNSVKNIGLE